MRLLILTILFLFASCAEDSVTPHADQRISDSNTAGVDLSRATQVQLWATIFYKIDLDPSIRTDAVPIRDMSNQVIGPSIAPADWCSAAVEGTLSVEGQVFNYAGTRSPRQARCKHRASRRVRWKRSPYPYGIGSKDNPLIPFKTIACDMGTVDDSRRWLNGGYARFGQKIYIPDAKGTALPDGSIHDGLFECGDVGGDITGNHIDVFIGAVRGGEAEALRLNPFSFVRGRNGIFDAYVLP